MNPPGMLELLFRGSATVAALVLWMGATVGRAEDSRFDLGAALAVLPAKAGAVLALPPGEHRLPPEGWRLQGLRQVIIDGLGATLIATSRHAPALQISDCEGLTLRNFQIDYDPLPFTQGVVQKVDPIARTVEVRLYDGYPGLGAVAPPKGGVFTDARLQVFDPKLEQPKVGTPDYGASRLEDAGDRVVRVTLPEGQLGIDLITPQDLVTISSRAAEGVTIRNSRDVILDGITIWSAPNVALLVRSCETGGIFRNVKIIPGPPPAGATARRLMSACADGLNISYTRNGPLVEQCEFSYLGDDSINFHGTMVPVLKWLDDRTFLAALPWRNNRFDAMTRSGDVVRFLEPPSYTVLSQNRIESVTIAQEPVEPWMNTFSGIWSMLKIRPESVTFYRVTLQSPVRDIPTGVFGEIPATAAPGFLIRNNYFHDHRARGLRIMSADGGILNNRFARIKGVAISLGPEFAFWRESGWARNITVSGNHILDVAQGLNTQLPSSYTLGAISVMVRSDPDSVSSFMGNENLVIENNIINGSSVSGISVSNARNVQIANNAISRVNLSSRTDAGRDYALTSTEPISIIRAEAQLKDNTILPHADPSPRQP